jgi:catechol 2,3-dioxygenase-like lactoylglutathione lyase family enzyme
MLSRIAVVVLLASLAQAQDAPRPLARFHHVHLNVVDPQASINFYTSRFAAEKMKFAGLVDAVFAQKSWLLFTKVNQPAPSDLVSTIWHIGWGAEDMKAEYDRQLKLGTKFDTPLTDISDIGGRAGATGMFYYAYVQGPDGELIEINTARHHNFGHLHLFSKDPVAAAEWYEKHFGVRVGNKNPKERIYRDVAIGPSASLMMDNVNIIIYPIAYIQKTNAKGWEGRSDFESTKGRVIDHIGFSVDNLEETISRLKAEGVKVTAEPRAIAGGRIKFAFVEGPDKMSIEVIEGHAESHKPQQ